MFRGSSRECSQPKRSYPPREIWFNGMDEKESKPCHSEAPFMSPGSQIDGYSR
jgi:hypothetical protein